MASETPSVQHFDSTPKRVKIIRRILVVVFVVLTCGLISTQIFYGPEGASNAKENRTTDDVIPANRGTIYDANDNKLAFSVDRYTVSVDPTVAKDWKSIDCEDDGSNKSFCHQINGKPVPDDGILGLSELLGSVLGRPAQEIAYDFTDSKTLVVDNDGNAVVDDSENLIYEANRSKIIASNVDPLTARAIKNSHIVGIVSLSQTSSREYPSKNVAGSQIGVATTAPDGTITAQSGMEVMMNEELAGRPGKRVFEQGGGGERIPMTSVDEISAVNGKDVKSSLDMDIQWKLQQVLDNEKATNTPAWAIGMVENVKTGEIVAIAGDGEPIAGSTAAALPSKAFNNSFEPGSLAKVLTTSGLIEAGLQEPESEFQVPDHITTVFGQEIHDAANHGVQRLTLAGIVGYSYNTGTTMASVNWPVDSRFATYDAFGLGKTSGMGFPGETEGILWMPEYWDGRMRDTVLFGQGMSVSALQITNAFATIANGGKDPVPTLITATRDTESDPWVPYPKQRVGAQVVSPETAAKEMGIMETGVVNAAMKAAQIPEIRVGGKTGTAEAAGANGALTSVIGDFIGIFPMDNPQYAVSIFLFDDHTQYPTQQAITLFKDVAQFVIQKEGIGASAPATYLPRVSW